MDILQRNNVHVSGQAEKAIVFVHGLGCDQTVWRLLVPAFKPDYKIVLLDYVGSGRSNMSSYDPERCSTLHGYAADIVDVCDALNLHDAILVGHSVSSMTCMLAATARRERINRLVMVCPSPRYLNDPPDYVGGFERADIDRLLHLIEQNQAGWAKYMAGIVTPRPEQSALAEELEATFCAMHPTVARRFAAATFLADSRDQLVNAVIPTLILQCTHDAIVPPQVATYLHAQLINSTLRQMQATGHCPHLTDPQETVDCIRDFLVQTA